MVMADGPRFADREEAGRLLAAPVAALRLRDPVVYALPRGGVPVAPAETLRALRAEADEIICLREPAPFYGIGLVYRDFHQLTDDEVIGLLAARSHPHMPGGGTM
jgi:putative phosphoribosyl transferase